VTAKLQHFRTSDVSVLASAGALPGAIASQTTPDAKFLSLNRWRKPSEVLCRNSNSAYLPFSPITSARHRPSTGPLPAAISMLFWPRSPPNG